MTDAERAAEEIAEYIESLGFDLSDDSDQRAVLLVRIRQIIDKHLC